MFSPASEAGNDVIVDFHTTPAALDFGGKSAERQDFNAGPADTIDLRTFQTSFRVHDNDRNGVLEQGESDGQITVQIDGNDTVLAFAQGSIRIENVLNMHSYDFWF